MNRPPLKKRMVLAVGRTSMATVLRMSKWLNPRRTQRLGKWMGDFMYLGSRRYRTVAIENLSLAFPEWSKAEVRRTARQTFRNFARGSLEFFYLHNVDPDKLDEMLTIHGMEHIDAALERGLGVILITAHMGNWELFARLVSQRGYKVNVIARDSDDPTMTGIGNTIREKAGYSVLSRDNAAFPSIRCLKRNEILGILPDQNTYSGIFVDFFGRPVATATGPAVFALKTGAPVICAFTRGLPSGKFEAVINPPLDIELSGNEEEDIRRMTAAFTKAIEDAIRVDPSQWLWLHRRWKRTHEAPKDGTDTEMVQ